MSIASSARGDVDERARRRAVYDAMVVPVLTAHNVPQEAWPQCLPPLRDRYQVWSPRQGEGYDAVIIQVLLERKAFFVPYPQQDQSLPQRRLPYCQPYRRATDRRLTPAMVFWGDDAAAAWDQAKVLAGWPQPLQQHQQQQQHQGSSSSSS